MPAAQTEYLTRRELAERWKCTPKTAAKKIEPFRLGPKQLRYDLARIEAYERQQTIQALLSRHDAMPSDDETFEQALQRRAAAGCTQAVEALSRLGPDSPNPQHT